MLPVQNFNKHRNRSNLFSAFDDASNSNNRLFKKPISSEPGVLTKAYGYTYFITHTHAHMYAHTHAQTHARTHTHCTIPHNITHTTSMHARTQHKQQARLHTTHARTHACTHTHRVEYAWQPVPEGGLQGLNAELLKEALAHHFCIFACCVFACFTVLEYFTAMIQR